MMTTTNGTCEGCTGLFERTRSTQRFCTSACYFHHRKHNLKKDNKCLSCSAPKHSASNFCTDCATRYARAAKDKAKLNRQRVFDHYGSSCACCGETEVAFLCIDHINGGGNKHRAQIKSQNIANWLVRNGFPAGFQTLCHNCNAARARGDCPHQRGTHAGP